MTMEYSVSKDLLFDDQYQVRGINDELIGTIELTTKGAFKAISRVNSKTQYFLSLRKAASWLFKNSSVKPFTALQYSMFD